MTTPRPRSAYTSRDSFETPRRSPKAWQDSLTVARPQSAKPAFSLDPEVGSASVLTTVRPQSAKPARPAIETVLSPRRPQSARPSAAKSQQQPQQPLDDAADGEGAIVAMDASRHAQLAKFMNREQDMKRLAEENADLRRQLQRARFDSSLHSGGDVTALKAEIARLHAHNAGSVARLEKEAQEAIEAANRAELRCAALERELKAAHAELDTHSAAMAQSASERQSAKAQVVAVQKQQSQKATEAQQLQRDLFLLRQEHAGCARHAYEVARLSQELKEAQAVSEDLRKKLTSAQADARKQTELNTEARAHIARLDASLQESADATARLRFDLGVVKNAQYELDAARFAHAASLEQLRKLQAEHGAMATEHAQCTARQQQLAGELKTAMAELGELRERDAGDSKRRRAQHEACGLARKLVRAMTPALGMSFVKSKEGDGVRITGVTAGGPADAAGFKRKDVLAALRDTPTLKKAHVHAALGALSPLDLVPATVYRGSQTLLLLLQVGAKGYSADDVRRLQKLAQRDDDSDFAVDWAKFERATTLPLQQQQQQQPHEAPLHHAPPQQQQHSHQPPAQLPAQQLAPAAQAPLQAPAAAKPLLPLQAAPLLPQRAS